MEQRLAFLRSFVQDTARDPAIARKAIQIIREARVPLRDHRAEWAALLRWVQRNVRFTAEPNERVQSAQYTLTERYGDCDDLHILLATLGHSIRLPFRFCLSGKDVKGKRIRWVEGTSAAPKGVNWSHIFLLSQWPPFRPTESAWAEATLDVPLGWDSMRDRIPPGRADLGAVTQSETALTKLRAHAAKIPWYSVAGTIVGGLASALLLRAILGGRKR